MTFNIPIRLQNVVFLEKMNISSDDNNRYLIPLHLREGMYFMNFIIHFTVITLM